MLVVWDSQLNGAQKKSYLSVPSEPGNTKMRPTFHQGARVLGWLLATTIVVLSLVPAELRPETGVPHNLEHFSIFFLTGLAFGFGYARRPIVVTFDLIIFAATIEIAQRLVPGRHARLVDFMVDVIALLIGASAGFAAGARTIRTHNDIQK